MKTGGVRSVCPAGLEKRPLAALLNAQTGLEVSLENDAKALAVSEKIFGVAKRHGISP